MKAELKNESGIALFLVLWIVMLLMVIVGEFCYTMKTEVNITRNCIGDAKNHYVAEAGINIATYELLKKVAFSGKYGDAGSNSGENEIEWRINQNIGPIDCAAGKAVISIGNESGKVNLNLAGEDALRLLFGGFNLDDNEINIIVDSIQDWRDSDNFHRFYGAEDSYYLSLSDPYECKNAEFESIEELLLVRGVTPEIFNGGLKEMVTPYPGHEWVDKRKWEQQMRMGNLLKKYKIRNLLSFETDKININAASPEMLLSLPSMTEEMRGKIIAFRKEKDITSFADLSNILESDVYYQWRPYIGFTCSPFYSITSMGQAEEGAGYKAVSVFLEIDKDQKEKYRVIKWLDDIQLSASAAVFETEKILDGI